MSALLPRSFRKFPSTAADELAVWVEKQRRRGVTDFVLQRHEEEQRDTIVCHFTWEDADNDSNRLALDMHDRATEEGRHLPGRQHAYVIIALRGQEPRDRRYITVEGAGDDVTYEPRETNGGMIAGQLMQHTQMSVQVALGHTGEIVAHYQRLLADSNTRVEKLEAQLWAINQSREEFETKRHEREMERLRAQTEEKDRDFFKERFDLFAPALLAKLMSSGSGPKGPSVATSSAPALADDLVNQFLASLTPEQMTAVLGLLAPEQQALVQQLYAAYGERELARQQAKESGLEAKTTH